MTESPDERSVAAQKLGKPVDHIGVVRYQLDKLLKEGILIGLDIVGEGMFSKSTEWSEVGIPNFDIRSTRMTRGRKYLIDEERIKDLRTVTTRMRQWLEKTTTDITGFRPWRYLYYKRYDEWVSKWKILTDNFNEVKQDILAHYDADIEDLRQDYIQIAENSWKSITALGFSTITYKGAEFSSLDDFRAQLIQSVLSSVPTREQIEANLKADYVVSILQGKEQIEAEMVRSAEKKAEIEVINAKKDAAISKAQAKADKAWFEKEHAQKMMELEEEEKNAKIEAMVRAEAEHIRTQFFETVSPIEQVFSQVRNEMAEVCIEAIESIKKNGHVRGRTADKLHGLVEFYQLTSIQDDPKLLIKLQELKAAIGDVGDHKSAKEKPARSPEAVIAALNGVVDLKDTIRKDLDETPSRFSFVELDNENAMG